MEGLSTCSKPPVYLQQYTGSPNNPTIAYSYSPVGYATATVAVSVPQLRSTHLEQNDGEPHLDDCSVTPSPRESTSRSPAESSSTSEDASFLSNNVERLKDVHRPHDTSGVAAHAVSPTESAVLDRDSSDEDHLLDLPSKESVTVPIEEEERCNGTSRPSSSSPLAPASPVSTHGITMNLLDSTLWDRFNSLGNEMIVTKPGRRLFPPLMVGVRGLDDHTEYTVFLRISPADPYRYKFLNMKWVAVEESEVMQNEDKQIFCHPNSPSTGQIWMKKPISFKDIKVSHSTSSKHGNILLHTMHKYVAQVVLEPAGQPAITIPIPNTEFIAVTAYQNSDITHMKITNNPFAKGFRDKEEARMRRPSTMLSSALQLPSLCGSPFGQTPLWHGMPQLACRIPPIPISGPGGDVLHSGPEEGQPAVLPTYPPPAMIPPSYPYLPPSTVYSHPDD